MTTKYKIFLLAAIILVVVIVVAVILFYSNVQEEAIVQQAEPTVTEEQETEPATPEQSVPPLDGFTPLRSPKSPPFVTLLNNANDVKIDLHYEGDYVGSGWSRGSEFYIPEGSDEKFLSLSKLKERQGQYAYGPEYHSIFTSEESHFYQGTPIYLFNPDSKYSVSHVGFQINDRDLISELKVAFAIDYIGGFGHFGKAEPSIFDKIFGVETAYACGPGIYLREVGSSNLTFIEETSGITWYSLEEPIALHGLSLNYCENPPAPRPSYCNNQAGDPVECWDYCYDNVSISNLANGNLRMHILYKPNDKEGFLKIQMANLILSGPVGAYYQPVMEDNFDHYYRAYLH
ncbi:MAG TPA: hypothetical protein VGA53_01800 [Candidatus Paceibacterota bacterium]